jgi:hypothetical protein
VKDWTFKEMPTPDVDKETTPQRKTAVPGLKRKDGSYIPAIVPPEWEAYHP